jgi:hypothetical protein
MQAAEVVRHAPQPRAADGLHQRIALFGLMFWLLADRAADEDETALLSACLEVALALREVLGAAGDDPAPIEKVLAEYADRI